MYLALNQYVIETRTKVVDKNISHVCNLIKRYAILKNQKWPYVTFKIILYIMNKDKNVH